MKPTGSDAIITFMRLATRLKHVRRQGWLDRGVPDPESSADHSWNLALFAWLVATGRNGLDPNRVLLIALVHDLPEALAGDTTPFDRHRSDDGTIPEDRLRAAPSYVAREVNEKHARERSALVQMVNDLPPAMAGPLIDAWDEYTAGDSPEARFVRQLDKLETLLQAELYLDQHPDIIIDSFRAGTDRDITDPALRQLLHAIWNSEPTQS